MASTKPAAPLPTGQTGPKRTKEQRERDLHKAAALYCRGIYQADIAAQLTAEAAGAYIVTQQMVSDDLKAIRARWRSSQIRDFDTLVSEELGRIDELERTYWGAWEKSCRPRQNSSSRQVNTQPATATQSAQPTGTNAGAPVAAALGITWAVSTQVVERDGNPSFLAGVERCIEARRKLLGLDKPEKKEVTGKDGGPVRVAAFDLSGLTDEQLAVLDAIIPADAA